MPSAGLALWPRLTLTTLRPAGANLSKYRYLFIKRKSEREATTGGLRAGLPGGAGSGVLMCAPVPVFGFRAAQPPACM